jgi:signal transduction histidine kinase/ActR/RegA family two-component response regulator
MPDSYQTKAAFEQEIRQRLGLVPNLYLSAPAAPEVLQAFWAEAKDAYLDNPLPALFKESLIVYLSRLGNARYCLARHAGYLLGGEHGYPGGDRSAAPHGVPQLTALLQTPAPDAAHLQAALGLLLATPDAPAGFPAAGDPGEQAILIACGAIYRDPERGQRARDAIAHRLGRQLSEQLFALIAYVAKLHFWVGLHEEIAIEPDMRRLMAQQPGLAQLLQAPAPPAAEGAGAAVSGQRDAEHQRFIALFSHELRNPVAAISAVSDMFQVVGMADDRLRSASNILHRQVQALGQTLDRMVDLSALMYGDARLARATVVIDDLIAGVLRELAPRLAEKGIGVDLQPAGRRLSVIGDARRLAQMVENLLLHALKVSRPPQPLQLRIAVDAASRQLSIAVTDHGPGFTLPPFPAPGMPDGHGKAAVALMLARAIAQLHGGSVRAESAGPGLGSTTTVTLPLAAAPDAAADVADQSGKQRLRVLAIEDNRDFAQLFRHMLEAMGCDLEIAADARSGLALARAIAPELIFCDIGLPGDMDGFAFARAVRADPALAAIPLVAVSGYNSPADVQRALQAGFDRVCGKPVKFADISDALATFAVKRQGAV